MGIKDLTRFLKLNAPESIKLVHLNTYKQKNAAIDISIFLYKYKYKNRNIIQKFLEQVYRLKLNDITPIYVFDGKPPKEKLNTLKERKFRLEESKIKQEKVSNELAELMKANNSVNNARIKYLSQELDKLNNKTLKVTKEDIESVKYFLDLLNIKYIHAPGEADILCSKLCRNNIAHMVISEDMDILTSGAPILMRDFNSNNNKILTFDLKIILEKLDLSYEKWVEFCILCGCDYVKRIYGLGPKFSFKLIKENSIEELLEILKKRKKVVIPENYLEEFYKAKEIFMNTNLEMQYDLENKELFDNQLVNVRSYLNKHTGLSDKQIDNRIKNIFNL